jgi:ATP-dependent Clp protease ATP-binding subunit ClpC
VVFERFTERAREVVVLAQDEARAFKHNYIGTEHLLLGLIREKEGIAARVIESFGLTLEEARSRVARIIGSGEEVTSGQIPFTPRAKKVLELSLREGLALGHTFIGTEHILLGLATEGHGVANQILLEFGVDSARIRDEVLRTLGGAAAVSARAASRPRRAEVRFRSARVSYPPLIAAALAGAAIFVGGLLAGWLIWG